MHEQFVTQVVLQSAKTPYKSIQPFGQHRVYLHLLQTLQCHGVCKESAVGFLQVKALFVGDTRQKLESFPLAFSNPHSATPCCAAIR